MRNLPLLLIVSALLFINCSTNNIAEDSFNPIEEIPVGATVLEIDSDKAFYKIYAKNNQGLFLDTELLVYYKNGEVYKFYSTDSPTIKSKLIESDVYKISFHFKLPYNTTNKDIESSFKIFTVPYKEVINIESAKYNSFKRTFYLKWE